MRKKLIKLKVINHILNQQFRAQLAELPKNQQIPLIIEWFNLGS